MSEILKMIDERETHKRRKKEKRKKEQWDGSYRETVRDKWFYWAFKSGLL